MTTNYGRPLFLFSVLVVTMTGLLSMTGCKGPTYPNCKNDGHCKIGASGDAMNGVCVFGKCEECAMNSDCKEGSQCMNNMCMTPCTADASCGDSKHCADGFCQKNCDATTACGTGRMCMEGRCVAEGATCSINSECASGYQCKSGVCRRSIASDAACPKSGEVHFDFDNYDIKSNEMSTLDQIGMCLRENGGINLLVEGHTDERGSTEYNLALGQRRAEAVRKYLASQGVTKDRLRVTSYGKEKPADPASNEEAWAKNRRSEIVAQ